MNAVKWAYIWLVLLFLIVPSTAVGQEEKTTSERTEEVKWEFKRLSASAQEKFAAGDLEGAIRDFEAAYAIKPVSNILYNIGRIHEQQGNIDEAISYYERFVVAPNVEIEARQEAVGRLRTLKEVRDLQKEGVERRTPESEDVQTAPAEPEVTAAATTGEPGPDRTVAWVFLGIGFTTLAGAGVFAILTSMEHDEFEGAEDLKTRRDAASKGEAFGLVSDGLLVTGLVTSALGAVFWFTADAPEREGIAVMPRVGPEGAAVEIKWSF